MWWKMYYVTNHPEHTIIKYLQNPYKVVYNIPHQTLHGFKNTNISSANGYLSIFYLHSRMYFCPFPVGIVRNDS